MVFWRDGHDLFCLDNGLIIMRYGIIPRILITLLGAALILMGVGQIMLGFAGEGASAVITHMRREGGERIYGKSGRYTYNISYTFTLPDGKEIFGFTKKIGDSVYLKPDGKSTTRIRYFSSFPYINAIESDTGLGAGQIVLILAGGSLIFLINMKKKSVLLRRNKRKLALQKVKK